MEVPGSVSHRSDRWETLCKSLRNQLPDQPLKIFKTTFCNETASTTPSPLLTTTMTSSTTATSLEPSVDKPISETPSSRRKHVPDTLDDSGHISIEQYIYRRDHYRSTSLALPLPLPMMAMDGFEESKNRYEAGEGLRVSIFDVLDKYDIRRPRISLEVQARPGCLTGKPSQNHLIVKLLATLMLHA